MLTRLTKEVRSLLLPAALSAAAALWSLGWFAAGGTNRAVDGLALRLLVLGFYLGVPLLAAYSFGAEFQQRTMGLLLSQPVTRRRIWGEKWAALLAVVAFIVTIQFLALEVLPQRLTQQIPVAAMYAVAVVCSAPMWTFVARSTIGGAAFSVAGFVMLEFACNYGLQVLIGSDAPAEPFSNHLALNGVRLAYSAVCLWVGWKMFAGFQVSAATGSGDLSGGTGWLGVLRPRPAGPLRNIVRKEVCIHRPTLLIAAGFAGCWLAAIGLFLLQPSRIAAAELVFTVLMAVYVPLAVVMAGTMSVSEDHSLGIHEWHLTLPVSSRAQWLTKLTVSIAIAGVCVILLPAVLTTLARVALPLQRGVLALIGRPGPLALVAGAVVISFWASTLFGHVTRAAVATGLAVLALTFSLFAGLGAGEDGRLGGSIVTWVMVRYHLPPDFLFVRDPSLLLAAGLLVCGIVAGWQSLYAFRRAQTDARIIARYAACLLAMAFVIGCSAGLTEGSGYRSTPVRELRSAIEVAVPRMDLRSTQSQPVPLSALESTGRLSPGTREWLRNAEVRVGRSGGPTARLYHVSVLFPNGRSYQTTLVVE